MTAAKKKRRSDRFGAPEGAESDKLHYRDESGKKMLPAQWLAKVTEDAKRKKK